MKKVEYNDFDFFFHRIREELGDDMGMRVMEEQDFGMGFHIQIPSDFILADEGTAASIFWSDKRPSIILLTPDREAGITFQFLQNDSKEHEVELKDHRANIKRVLERIDDRVVIYDMGESDKRIYWLEFKNFAFNERIYNILFLFHAKEQVVMGTFYCIFEEYEKWKSVIFNMISTIDKEEEHNDRL